MKHGVGFRKLNKSTKHRWAMLRNLVTSLIQHERIRTTVPKAKELRRVAEQMVTLGKRGDLHARRQAAKVVRDKATLHKLFATIAPRYQERNGGYTRILRVGPRYGDMADMAIIEYVDRYGELRPASRPWELQVKAIEEETGEGADASTSGGEEKTLEK